MRNKEKNKKKSRDKMRTLVHIVEEHFSVGEQLPKFPQKPASCNIILVGLDLAHNNFSCCTNCCLSRVISIQ